MGARGVARHRKKFAKIDVQSIVLRMLNSLLTVHRYPGVMMGGYTWSRAGVGEGLG